MGNGNFKLTKHQQDNLTTKQEDLIKFLNRCTNSVADKTKARMSMATMSNDRPKGCRFIKKAFQGNDLFNSPVDVLDRVMNNKKYYDYEWPKGYTHQSYCEDLLFEYRKKYIDDSEEDSV